jgi:hypothetical protein
MLSRMMTCACSLPMLALILGCGPSEKPAPTGLVPFSGTVTMDGKPIGGAAVTLIPATPGAGLLDASGTTDDSGKVRRRPSGRGHAW